MAEPTPGPITCSICGETGFWSIGSGREYEHDTVKCEKRTTDRLKSVNEGLMDACQHVIKWLGEPSLEKSENAHPAFRKALSKCRAALAKANQKVEWPAS